MCYQLSHCTDASAYVFSMIHHWTYQAVAKVKLNSVNLISFGTELIIKSDHSRKFTSFLLATCLNSCTRASIKRCCLQDNSETKAHAHGYVSFPFSIGCWWFCCVNSIMTLKRISVPSIFVKSFKPRKNAIIKQIINTVCKLPTAEKTVRVSNKQS